MGFKKVLIHSATGGVGHASIQICTAIGAEVGFPTLSSKTLVSSAHETRSMPRWVANRKPNTSIARWAYQEIVFLIHVPNPSSSTLWQRLEARVLILS